MASTSSALIKLLRAFNFALAAAAPIIVWFTGDLARYSMKLSPLPSDRSLDMMSHIWAVQFAASILSGFFWPVSMPVKNDKELLKKWWGRSFVFAAVGGIIGGQLLLGLRPIPTSLLMRLLFPLLLAIFGLVQISLVGLTVGSFLRNADVNPKTI